jgi:hypothetical protein
MSRANENEMIITQETNAMVSREPIILKSMAMEVVQTAVEVSENAMAVPMGIPWFMRGLRKRTSAPLQK